MAMSRKRAHSSTSASHPPPRASKKKTKFREGNRRRRNDEEDDPQVVYHGKDSHAHSSVGDDGAQRMSRKRLDPQTKSYFLEIAALVDGGEGDSEERESMCMQALEECRGQEFQLACDPSCGRALESLLVSCDISLIVQFLSRCTSVAVDMAVDPSGSHILETALKTVGGSLLDENGRTEVWFASMEHTLSTICQEIGTKAVDVMCNRYGSHVLRCIFSFLSGDTSEFFSNAGSGVKPSRNLADKLGTYTNKPKYGQLVRPKGLVFPDIMKSLVDKIFESSKGKMSELRTDLCASPVLQALLKALQGKQETVVQAIAMILDCDQESFRQEGAVLQKASVEEVVTAMKDRSSSHLMEVVIQSAPNKLYLEIFQRFFRKRLLQASLHASANFTVQVLIACVRHEAQVNMIFEELEGNFTDLVFNKRSGVIAALLAACGRFRTCQKEACRALAVAVNSNQASPVLLVPRLLHLESASEDGTFLEDLQNFSDSKMSVIGSVILQTLFNFPKECSQQFCSSMAAMESGNLLHTIRDASGSRALEAFLESPAAPTKQKHRIISKLEGRFAELALHPVSCFTVEKSFVVADIRLKEKIASELVPVQSDLSKSRHGARVSRRCDIAGYAKKPEQWRMKENTKQSTHKAFTELFKPDVKQEVLHDEPGEVVFVKKEEIISRKETDQDAPHKATPPSKKAKRKLKSVTSKEALGGEKVRDFEAMLLGL